MKNISAQLPAEVLVKSQTLPLKPVAACLRGRRVKLEPLDLSLHLEPLFAVSSGKSIEIASKFVEPYDAESRIWRHMSDGPFGTSEQLESYLQKQVDSPNGLCFCVTDLDLDHPVGVANMMNNVPSSLKMELGSIWYSPLAQGSLTNTEATYLMLRHAFELGYRRVEWKCDSLNERSKKSALRLGFTFEGEQECHFIVKGRNRDTSWFRILDREWESVRGELEKMLGSST